MVDPSAWDVIAEERIRAAQQEGKFDNLPGAGKPIPDLDRRDPNWWIKGKLKAERISVLPPALEAKLLRERLLERLHDIPTEPQVRARLAALNERIQKAALTAPADIPVVLIPVDIEAAVREWRSRNAFR